MRPLATALATALASVLTLLAPPAQATQTIRLDGVTVEVTAATRQVITVKRTSGTWARVAFWGYADGHWVRRAVTGRGRIGYGGLVAPDQRRQGSGTTPTGTYGLPFAFGTGARHAAWDLSYRRIRAGDYWVGDNDSTYYNRYRNKAQGGFRWWLDPSGINGSERLAAYPRQYEMSVVIGYNYAEQVRYRGSGIFLHVSGSGSTAGCVSAPRWFLADTLRRLHPAAAPVIAIGA